MSSSLTVDVAEVFYPLLNPARYKGAYGGRGSGKSWFFAEQLVLQAYSKPIRAVCIREVQNTIKDSVKQLLVDKIGAMNLHGAFEIQDSEIKGKNGSLIVFRGMQSYNADNIKSLENFNRAWVEEAQSLSERSFDLLRPTIRAEGSELWFSWNPRHKTDVVDYFFRGPAQFPGAVAVRANWNDNPWFPSVLKDERKADYERDPDKASHVWEGEYERITEGAYYARLILQAEREGRIRDFEIDRSIPVHTAWDLGKRSNNVIWCWQNVNDVPHIVDFYSPPDGDLKVWAEWLASKGYHGNDYVPHDIMTEEWGTGRTRWELLRTMGRKPTRVASVSVEDGRNAARLVIEKAVFHKSNCDYGIDGLRSYRREWDQEMGRFKDTPIKNWADHIADGFRYLALAWRDMPKPAQKPAKPKELEYQVTASGLIQGNASVREAVEAMIRRKRREA